MRKPDRHVPMEKIGISLYLLRFRYVTATIRDGTGDPNDILAGNVTVPFPNGWENFTDLSISHNSSDYILDYHISYHSEAKLQNSSAPFDVKQRSMYFILRNQPKNANETVPFGQQPVVIVYDAANGDIVRNTGWKDRLWLCNATLVTLLGDYKGI